MSETMSVFEEPIPLLNELPIFFLLSTKTGLSAFSKSFDPSSHINGILLGGFLSALNCFASETLAVSGDLKMIKFEDTIIKIHTSL